MFEKTTTEGQYTIGLALFMNMTKGFSSCCVFFFLGLHISRYLREIKFIFMNRKSVQFYDFNTHQKDTKKYFCTY